MTPEWIADFEKTNKNALTMDWFVSPLEYGWGDGKAMFDGMFRTPSAPSPHFDSAITPEIFQASLQVDFRAKMMVFAFMRENISKSFGVEIENGLMHLYRLDFLSCISQWIYVVEGYCRKLFKVTSTKDLKTTKWKIPKAGVEIVDRTIKSLSDALAKYLKEVMFGSTENFQLERLNRHLVLHGNVENKRFFSQKNCLLLLFILDTLVFIEMSMNLNFPKIFEMHRDDAGRIDRRKAMYMCELQYAMSPEGIKKANVLREHLGLEVAEVEYGHALKPHSE